MPRSAVRNGARQFTREPWILPCQRSDVISRIWKIEARS
jgi:hypothetical protein